MAKLTTKEIDIHVGSRLKRARVLRGLSQQKLAGMLKQPISHQQLQKYEKGQDRISAGRIFEIGNILGCKISYFFEVIDNK